VWHRVNTRLGLTLVLATLALSGCGTPAPLAKDAQSLRQALVSGAPLDEQLEATAAGTPDAPRPVTELDLSRPADRAALLALSRLSVGDRLAVRHGAGAISVFVVDLRETSGDTLEVRGHLVNATDKAVVLGLGENGASGFFEMADGSVQALAYADAQQVSGLAGDDWLTDRLAPRALRARQPTPGEVAPVPGAMPVDIDLVALTGMQPGEATVMQFPGMGAARVTLERIDLGADSNTWVGHLADFGHDYPVLLTYSAEAIEGSALTPRGEVVLTDGHAYNPQLMGLVNAKLDGENCAFAHHIAESATAAATTTGNASAVPAAAAGTQATNSIDVLVYYSPDMETRYGSAAAVATRVDALFAAANQAYGAASLGYTLRRVGLKKVAVSETLANDSVLSRLQAGTGEFASMRSERDAAGADLVTMIRPLRAAQHGSCGVGYIGGYGGSDIRQYSDYMTSVVGDGSDRTGAAYYCDTMTLAHETGHNLGLMHDRATVASQGGGTGVKPYAFGYAVANTWGTIMSYTSPVQYRFSNPVDRTCPGNTACGVVSTATNSADNAQALGHSLPLVAAFRTGSSTATTQYTVSGLVTLDGKPISGVSLSASNAGVRCAASGSTGLYTCQAEKGLSFSLTPNLTLTGGGKPTWSPASASFSAIAANATAHFAGTSPKVTTFSISGKITLDGKAVAGSTPKVSGSGATCGASNSTGTYTCTANKGASFSLSPNVSAPAGYSVAWTPPSIAFSNLQAGSSTAHFSGKSTPIKYTVSGKIMLDGKAVAGSTPKISGSGVTCGASNSSGVYACSANAGASFTLSPNVSAKTGTRINWSPESLAITKLAAARSTAHFTGTSVSLSRSITGVVTVNVNGTSKALAGASLKASIAGVTCSLTGSTGAYSCSTTATSSFTLVPSYAKTGHTFKWLPLTVPASGNVKANFGGAVTCPASGCKL